MALVTFNNVFFKVVCKKKKNIPIAFCEKKKLQFFHWKRNVVILFWLPKNNSIHLCAKFACVVYKKRERERTPEIKGISCSSFPSKNEITMVVESHHCSLEQMYYNAAAESMTYLFYLRFYYIHIGVCAFLREQNKVSRSSNSALNPETASAQTRITF